MKVVLCLEPGRDGAFRHVEGLAQHLWRQGDLVHLAYSSRRTCPDLSRLVEQVRSRGGRTVDLHVGPEPDARDVSAAAALRALVVGTRPDVLHAHSSKAGVLARVVARTLRAAPPVVYTPHAMVGMDGAADLRTRAYVLGERLLGRLPATVVAISPDEASYASRRAHLRATDLVTVHNPVDVERFRPADRGERARARTELGLSPAAVVVAFMARSVPQKDPLTLYAALAGFMHSHPDVQVCHVGEGALDGPLDGALPEPLRRRVVRHPRLACPERIYQAADCLALSSRYEAGWPLVALEALAADLPIVATTAPGMCDIGATGLSHVWTARVGDSSGLQTALERWIDDRERARPSNHRTVAEQRFAPEVLYEEIRHLYRRLSVSPSLTSVG